MKEALRKKYLKVILVLVLVFAALFISRLLYGNFSNTDTTHQNNVTHTGDTSGFVADVALRKNYATEKVLNNNGPSIVQSDQKYEKIADIISYTTFFDQKEKVLRNEIEKYQGLVQFENKFGNEGYRTLRLIVGVPPKNFDSIYQSLIKVGHTVSKQVTKNDKTNEYRELNAKRETLEKVKNALMELKSKGGTINDFIQLENRILEIEQELQMLGVNLGNFDTENEFCTVKIVLNEKNQIPLSQLDKIYSALGWTLTVYLKLLAILSLLMFFTYLTITSIQKLNNK